MRLLFEYIFGKPKLAELQKDLSKSPLFENFLPREIKRVLEHATLRTFAKGEHVFFEGDTSSALYVILRGSVDILTYRPKRILLTQLYQGTFFGEMLNEGFSPIYSAAPWVLTIALISPFSVITRGLV